MKASFRFLFRVLYSFLLVAVLVLIQGCAGSREAQNSRIERLPVDLPDHFLVGAMEGGETTEPVPDNLCRSPMVDPRDSTRLVLVHSAGGRGDYEVPVDRYGVEQGFLLRIECGTGRAVSIVRR